MYGCYYGQCSTSEVNLVQPVMSVYYIYMNVAGCEMCTPPQGSKSGACRSSQIPAFATGESLSADEVKGGYG